MRLGLVFVPNSNANYRALAPLRAMARRGHEIAGPVEASGRPDFPRLATCDVVHVYRRADEATLSVLARLIRAGVRLTFDNDDDLTAIPRESPHYKKFGGATARRLWRSSVKAARLARVFTTTNETLAAKYRAAGVKRIEIVGNYLDTRLARPRNDHEGIVIGWVAGVDHQADVGRVGIVDALERLLAKHADVRVESIGVDLGLSERYRHDPLVEFARLPDRIGGFDIGIAPLADLPCNRARSDIKLKEYAASGVPWLASPIGPYLGLGEEQGGRLVADHEWFEALDRLVTEERERRLLAQRAAGWSRSQTIDSVAGKWEEIFLEAAGSGAPGGS
jgi:glycosyltransferase involved in cell wall biosynthesis